MEPCIYLHVEESGNPDGIPVVFVHGGPGWHSEQSDHQWFDPDKYRIILFHQRGTGNSYPTMFDLETPADRFKEVTLDTLVEDLETLRKQLEVKKWLVFGGSWGSTLSLAYAEKYSGSCFGLTLRGIYLATNEENYAFFKGLSLEDTVVKKLLHYPALKGLDVQLDNPASIYAAYKTLIVDQDDPIAAKIWAKFEMYVDEPQNAANSAEILDDSIVATPEERSTAFWQTLLFEKIPRTTNLLDVERLEHLKGMKIRIVQGGSDNLCQHTVADMLTEGLTKAGAKVMLKKVPEGSHSAYDPLITHALVQATDAFARELSNLTD